MIGVEIGNDELTITIATVATIISAFVNLIRRFWKGDVTVFGAHR